MGSSRLGKTPWGNKRKASKKNFGTTPTITEGPWAKGRGRIGNAEVGFGRSNLMFGSRGDRKERGYSEEERRSAGKAGSWAHGTAVPNGGKERLGKET